MSQLLCKSATQYLLVNINTSGPLPKQQELIKIWAQAPVNNCCDRETSRPLWFHVCACMCRRPHTYRYKIDDACGFYKLCFVFCLLSCVYAEFELDPTVFVLCIPYIWVSHMIDRLIDWLIDWLINWLIDWLIGASVSETNIYKSAAKFLCVYIYIYICISYVLP